MLELWGVEVLEEEGKHKLRIGKELLELEGGWKALYGIGNPDPKLVNFVMFKFPYTVLVGKGEKSFEFWFYPDLILKLEGEVIKVFPKELKYSLYGDISEGIIARRIKLYDRREEGMARFFIKIKNEFVKGVEISRIVLPMKWMEDWKESPEEFSVDISLKIKGNRGGEVELLRDKRVKYEMIWGFS